MRLFGKRRSNDPGAGPPPGELEDRALFLGLGPTKTGTSWLYYYLDAHPEFLCSPIKELHFFSALHHPRNRERYDRKVEQRIAALAGEPSPANRAELALLEERLGMTREPGGGLYQRFFRERLDETHRAFGELSPSYCALTREGFEYIRAFHPKVRLLLTLRDPLDRVDAVIRHMAKHGRDMSYDRFTNSALPRRLETHNFHYHRIVDNLRAVFDPGELRIQFFETMFEQAAIDEIADFIGISHRPGDFDFRPAHSPPASPRSEAHRARLLEHLAPIYRACRDRFGDRIPEQWAM